jgi:outer membrane receptor protein involved in Fe transport
MRRLALTAILHLAVSICVLAQSPTATLSGRVLDPTQAAISGASVAAVNMGTNVVSHATTNDEGFYTIVNLPPGSYRAEVTKPGFKTLIRPDLVLHVQDVIAINFKLSVGAVSESITVEGGAPLVNTESAAVSTVVDRKFAENLPLNGRSFQTLIQMTPGVALTPSTGYDPGQFSVNGQRTSSNYWMVDGVAANLGVSATSFVNGAGMAGTVGSYSALGGTNGLVSVDALEEFRIQTSTYAPEFGRTPGAQISIVTRSGTDQFHGSVFDYFRNEALDANDWFADNLGLPKPPERQNDFGGTFSGPLLKRRTFFFFSYEGLRLKLPQVVPTSVPCDATCTIAGNVRADAQPAMQPYLNAFPLPNGPELQSQFGTAEFNASYANSASLDAYSLRLDHKLKDKLSLFGRYDYSPSEILTRGGNGSFAPALSQVVPSRITIQTATAGLTWMLSPKASDDFRFNYSRVMSTGRSYLDGFDGAVPPSAFPLPSPFSLADSAFDMLILTLTNPVLLAGKVETNLQRQLNFVNSFSLSQGAHNIKFGIDYRRLSPLTSPLAYGQLVFFNDIPSTLANPPQVSGGYELQSYNTAALLFQNVGVYAQDTWRANSRLTFTYGLRWDIDFVPTATNGFRLVGVTGYSTTDLSNIALAAAGTPLFRTYYASLAPRIGAAYQLSQNRRFQTVVRGGFGVFYDLATSQVGNLIVQSYPFSAFSQPSVVNFPLSAADAAPPPIIPPDANQGILGAFDPNLRSPYTLQWNFAVEQGLGDQQMLSLSYVGAKGSRLIESAQISNPNPNYGNVVLIGNTASSNYNALQAQFTRRLSKGLQALASYTWSHSLDDASTGLGNSSNAFGGGASSYGPSDFDIRHSFSAALTYDVPTPRMGGRFLRPVLAGWSTENIIQARSATPIDVFNGLFNQLHSRYNLNVRPDVVPGQPLYLSGAQCSVLYLSQCPGGRGFNPGAFVNPPLDSAGNPLRQGNLSRNALRAFGSTQWDFAVHRDFPIHESVKLQFRAELFNVLNHPNFGPQLGDLSLPQFGVTTQMLGTSLSGRNVGGGGLSPLYQVGGPRSIQLALKLTF